ncbi:MAG: alanine/glycine:cation symporter family protein [Senegalimassilia faecalis]
MGTGNIAGVATAIATGDQGAVCWMGLMALVGAASACVESTLAQMWKVRGIDGEFRGGPAYYIHQALGSHKLGVLFSVLLILCFAFGFNGLQAFNACSALEYYIPNYATNGVAAAAGLALVVLTAGLRRVRRLEAVRRHHIHHRARHGHRLHCHCAVDHHLQHHVAARRVQPDVRKRVRLPVPIFGGFAGSVVMLGIKRGLYENEAGIGCFPNAAATASVSHPVKQGLVQSLSVYIDTLLICTCSAMMVLVFYIQGNAAAAGLNGMPLVQMAVNNAVGPIGIHFITFAIFMFAYFSLIGNYFYAESNFRFIKNDSETALVIFRLACLAVIFYGAVNSFDLAWNLADIFMGLMAIMNLIAILLLGKWALAALKDYSEQRAAGKDPVFLADSIPGLPKTECWHLEEVKDFGEAPVKEYFEEAVDVEVDKA